MHRAKNYKRKERAVKAVGFDPHGIGMTMPVQHA